MPLVSDDYLNVSKIAAFLLITIISLLFGVIPFYLVRWFNKTGRLRSPRVQSFISGVICFSGGTLLGVTFLHLMPEMRENLDELIEQNDPSILANTNYPMGDILICCGFFFVYIFDEMMHMFIEWYVANSEKRANKKMKLTAAMGGKPPDEPAIKSHRFTCNMRGSFFPCMCLVDSGSHFHLHHPDGHRSSGQATQEPDADTVAPAIADHHSDGHGGEVSQYNVGPLSGLITIIALSFHDIFEGLAIGVEDSTDAVLLLYASIATHKYAIGFCIGLDLALSSTRLCVIWIYMFTYSIVSPIGIVLGALVGAHLDLSATVVMQGLAGGTLIYVVCFEVLQREGSETHIKGILNAFCVIFGFLLTLIFLIVLSGLHPACGLPWADSMVCIDHFSPRDQPLHALNASSSVGHTWTKMQALCDSRWPGYAVAMSYEQDLFAASCPQAALVPISIVKEDGALVWKNIGGLANKRLKDEELAALTNPNLTGSGTYGALRWQTSELILVDDVTRFQCTLCQRLNRCDILTQAVYPTRHFDYAYDLQLVSNDPVDDLASVAPDSDLGFQLLIDLAVAFNIFDQSLRWQAAELDADGRALVHVFYEPGTSDRRNWLYFLQWKDKSVGRRTVPNFDLKSITLNVECISELDTQNKQYFTDDIETISIDTKLYRITVRECYWNTTTELAVWSPPITWDTVFVPCPANNKEFEVAPDSEYMKKLLYRDIAFALSTAHMVEHASHKPFRLEDVANMTQHFLFLQFYGRPMTPFALLPNFFLLSLAKIYMNLDENTDTTLVSMLNINLQVTGLDVADPVRGLYVTKDDVDPRNLQRVTSAGRGDGKNTVTTLSAGQLSASSSSLSTNATIVVTVSDSIASNADRLGFLALSAHLDAVGGMAPLDPVIDNCLSLVQVSYIRNASRTVKSGEDFVDIAFKPAFKLATLRGKCAERVFETEKWHDDSCRVLEALRGDMVVCRCRDLPREGNFTSALYLLYGSDASLIRYLADHRYLTVCFVVMSIFSALGTVFVFVTAALFPEWRSALGHQIVLQMAIAMFVNLGLGFINSFGNITSARSSECIGMGALRHYSFLAMFVWMTVLPGLQVTRLMASTESKASSFLILKISVLAWGLPLIPTVTLLAWDTGFYRSEVANTWHCYPSGVAFHAAVRAPAGVILLANLVILVIIHRNVYGWCRFNKNTELRKNTVHELGTQISDLDNSIGNFVLFGLTWIFHCVSEEGIVNGEFLFEFLFLGTVSFHMFLLSLLFIGLDKNTRHLWRVLLGNMSIVRPSDSIELT